MPQAAGGAGTRAAYAVVNVLFRAAVALIVLMAIGLIALTAVDLIIKLVSQYATAARVEADPANSARESFVVVFAVILVTEAALMVMDVLSMTIRNESFLQGLL
jgi:hypothetical protein